MLVGVRSTAAEGARPDDARRHNREAVLRRLHVGGECTRAVLTAELGLNRSTIKAVVDGLAESGWLSERLPSRRSGVGRPSRVVVARPEAAVVLAVDVRVDLVSLALVGLGDKKLGQDSWPLRAGAGAPGEVVTQVVDSARVLENELGGRAVAAGVSVPGVVRQADGLVRKAPQLDWTDVALGKQLKDALRMPVAVASDGELGALAEHTRGVARGESNVVFVACDVGVGCGVISGGAVLRGLGEFGHMVVRPDGRECHCGCRGCWETEMCEAALRRALGLPADTGRGELIVELRKPAADPPAALARFEEFASWLAIGLVNVVNMLAPELVVLGNLLAELPRPVLDAVAAQVGERSMVSRAVGHTRVVASELGAEAQLVGAAELAFGPVLLDAATGAATT